MRTKTWLTVVVLVVSGAAGASALAARGGAVRDDSIETAGASAAAAANAGHLLTATGGYHFTIPADFNGGIFGTLTDIKNRVTFNAKKDADGSVSGWWTYEQEVDGGVFKFGGPVTCLNIYDTPVLTRTPDIPPMTQNRAKWGGRVEKSNDETIPVGRFMCSSRSTTAKGPTAIPTSALSSAWGTRRPTSPSATPTACRTRTSVRIASEAAISRWTELRSGTGADPGRNRPRGRRLLGPLGPLAFSAPVVAVPRLVPALETGRVQLRVIGGPGVLRHLRIAQGLAVSSA